MLSKYTGMSFYKQVVEAFIRERDTNRNVKLRSADQCSVFRSELIAIDSGLIRI